jgi:hypothetical protein
MLHINGKGLDATNVFSILYEGLDRLTYVCLDEQIYFMNHIN